MKPTNNSRLERFIQAHTSQKGAVIEVKIKVMACMALELGKVFKQLSYIVMALYARQIFIMHTKKV